MTQHVIPTWLVIYDPLNYNVVPYSHLRFLAITIANLQMLEKKKRGNDFWTELLNFKISTENFFCEFVIAFGEERSEVWIDRCPTLPVRTDGMKRCDWLCGEHAKQSGVLACTIYFVLTTDQATNKQNLVWFGCHGFIYLSHGKTVNINNEKSRYIEKCRT